jgi:hypothetical protein
VFGEREHDRGSHDDARHAVALDRGEERLELEFGERHDCCTGAERGAQHDLQSRDVTEGEGSEDDVLL